MRLFLYILSKPDGATILARWRDGFIECSEDGFYNWLERREFARAALAINTLLAGRGQTTRRVYRFSRA